MLLGNIGNRTKKRLAVLIMTLLENEQKLEAQRVNIGQMNGIDPATLYGQIDVKRRGVFTIDDLSRYLKVNCIHATSLEINYLMSTFNRGTTLESVSFPAFNNTILDAKSLSQQQAQKQLSANASTQSLRKDLTYQGIDQEKEFLFVKLLHQMIQNFKIAENKKNAVVTSDDFSLEAAFKAIDLSNLDKIDSSSIQEFLSKNNREATEKQITVLIKLFSNRKEDYLIQSDFNKMILPFNSSEQSSRNGSQLKIDGKNQSLIIIQKEFQTDRSTQETIKKETRPEPIYGNERQLNETVKKTISKGNLSGDFPNYNYEKAMRCSQELNVPFENCITRSAMKGNEESIFVRLMGEIVQRDISVEEKKQELAMQKDFNLLDFFSSMDASRKGYLTQEDFILSLQKRDLNPSKQAVYLFFKEHSVKENAFCRKEVQKDNQFSRLEFSEFVKAFLPIENQLRNALNNRLSSGKDFVSSQTLYLSQQLLKEILENVESAERIRQELNRRRLFDTYDAFCALDFNSKGFIQIEDMRQLFVDYDIHYSANELNYFFKRFDKALDGEVTYGEFFKEITPKCPFQIARLPIGQSEKSI